MHGPAAPSARQNRHAAAIGTAAGSVDTPRAPRFNTADALHPLA